MIKKENIFEIDIYDEWYNLKGTKKFKYFKDALKSGLKVLEEDKTEQLIGFSIWKNDRAICSKSHNKEIKYYNKKYNPNKKITRFELMEI